MRFRYPKSFLNLLLFGITLVILPLIVAFINTNIAFNTLAQKSQLTVKQAVETTRINHLLKDQVLLMERSARQYLILGDDDLLKQYQDRRADFQRYLIQAKSLNNAHEILQQVNQLEQAERTVSMSMIDSSPQPIKSKRVLSEFESLGTQMETLIATNNQLIDAASRTLKIESDYAQNRFFSQSLIMIPLTLIVAGLITYMIASPIRKMDKAIEHLGKGEYHHSIEIDGPGDLKILGKRLDWLRSELENLKHQKQVFLQHISHELKTPLTAIREATELLNDGIGGKLSTQQSEITQILKVNSLRLQKMIENLLNFTRLESGKVTLKKTDIHIQTLLEEIIHAHALTIRNKELQLTTEVQIPSIVADKEKLYIVLDNLISNAVKYTQNKGTIHIHVHQDKLWQLIEVIDNGPGFNESDQSHIFDPFYQGQALHQGLVQSTGLGLAIAKNLIDAHLGVIMLNPKTKGAHLIVKLPKTK